MKSMKTVKIIFIKSPTPVFNLAYFDGDILEMNANQAEVLIEAGVAKLYEPVFNLIEDLPMDFPGRDALIAFGIKTMQEVRLLNDPTEIKGIGKKTAEAILEYLKK